MTRIISFALAIIGLISLPVRAADQTERANSPKADFHLTQNMVVGTTTLKPGNYKVQCVMAGDKEFLVVTSADDGKEVARVPCHPEELQAKTQFSDFRFTKRADGVAELTGARIRGEKVEHRVTTD